MAENATKTKIVSRAAADRSTSAVVREGAPVQPNAEEVDAELEDALEQTFPASDPVAMQSTLVPGRRR